MTRSFRVVRPAWVVAGAVAASAGALAGCGGGEDGASATKAASTRSPAATVPAELRGSWTRRFRPREVRQEGGPAGLYTLDIGDGIADVFEGPKADPTRDCLTQEWCFEVTLQGSGHVLTVGETPVCPGTGRYSFTVGADTLTDAEDGGRLSNRAPRAPRRQNVATRTLAYLPRTKSVGGGRK
jgi:hypothetical protein